MLYDEWQKVYVKVLNNKNTKDIDRIVRLTEDITSVGIVVGNEMKENLNNKEEYEKYIKAQGLMKEMSN